MTLRSSFFQHIAQTSPFSMAFEVSHAEGSKLYDENGKAYIDFVSGIGVSNLGHQNPKIISAIHRQVDQHLHTMVYGEHIQSPQILLAKKLTENLPLSLQKVYFLSSGAEAIECALKLALKHSGRNKIISCANAYHGSTISAMSLMSDNSKKNPYGGGLKEVKHIAFNDISSLSNIDDTTACVVTEVIQAEAGIIPTTKEFLLALEQRCNETNTLLLFDEIQSGMGRSGSLFAFEQYGVTPAILVLGKSLGGGMPLSATIANEKLMNSLANDPPLTHMTTFGGHPVCCAAGLASLEMLIDTDVITTSKENAAYLLEALKNNHSIKEIRTTNGLWMAIDLGNASAVQATINKAMEKGLLMDWFLFNDESIRIAPPLNISENDLDRSVEILKAVL